MRKLITILLIIAVINCAYIRKDQETIQTKEKTPRLVHIPLTRTVVDADQKRSNFEFIKTGQRYLYGDDDLNAEMEALGYDAEPQTSYSPTYNAYSEPTASFQAPAPASTKKTAANKSQIKKIDLYNFKNTQYTGDFAVGDPSNTFQVIYDTGSANLWLNSARCQSPGCKNHKQYDDSKSKNFKKMDLDLDVEFGTGELKGSVNQDTVYVGGIEVDNQAIAEITQEIGPVFEQSKFDGIVGLAFPQMAAYDENPVFDNIIAQNRLESNAFSFYMDNKDGGKGSKLVMGGADPDLYIGDLNYHRVTDEYYWEFKADNILVGGKDIGLCPADDPCFLIADSGTSLITGPSDNLLNLLNTLNVDEGCQGVEKLPDITFVVDGSKYTMLPEEYVMTVNDDDVEKTYSQMTLEDRKSGECAGAFMPLDIPEPQGPNAWILGDVFLQKYYSVYDRDTSKVGFALAKK